jgi:hypothetical protein
MLEKARLKDLKEPCLFCNGLEEKAVEFLKIKYFCSRLKAV